jgi:hypothetical protein
MLNTLRGQGPKTRPLVLMGTTEPPACHRPLFDGTDDPRAIGHPDARKTAGGRPP